MGLIEAFNTFFASNFSVIDSINNVLRSPLDLELVILIVESKFWISLPFGLFFSKILFTQFSIKCRWRSCFGTLIK